MVSIIVPIYNREKTIKKCIESLLAQTYTNIEVILVDDGSADGSGTICDEYALIDERVKTFHIENSGVSNARNIGLNNATGEYISFVDSDDYISPEYVELLYLAIKSGNDSVSMCNYSEIRNGVVYEKKVYKRDLPIEKLICDFFYGRTEGFFSCAKLFRKELLKYKFEPYRYCEDVLFVYRNIRECEGGISVVPDCLYYYVRQPESTTQKNEYNALLDMSSVALNIIESSKNDYDNYLYPAYSAAVNWSFFIYFSSKKLVDVERKKIRDIAFENIQQYRKNVLKDPKASFKTKFACLFSYASMNLLEYIYDFMNLR